MGKITTNFNSSVSVIEMLNRDKPTYEYVLTNLNSVARNFQAVAEELRIAELKTQATSSQQYLNEEVIEHIADKVCNLILKDTAESIRKYVTEMSDNILDAINNNAVQKDNAWAFLNLLQTMETCFCKKN